MLTHILELEKWVFDRLMEPKKALIGVPLNKEGCLFLQRTESRYLALE